MSEQVTEYRVTYTKANVDALRADDKATIARLTGDVGRTALERNRAEAERDKLRADVAELRAANERAEQSLAKAHQRLELIGSVIDKDNLDRASLHDAIDEILTCQVIPPQCQHCGGLTDPDDAGMCHLCNYAYAKADAEAIKAHMAGV